MDFRAATIECLDRLIAAGHVEKCIEEQLAKTIKEIIRSKLENYSDFGKQLSEAVKQSLALNGQLDLPSYNDALLKILRHQVEHLTNATIQQQVAARMKDLLEPPPKEIAISELVEKYIETVKERNARGCVCHGDEQITLIVERDGNRLDEFVHIHLDDEPRKKKYDCDIQIDAHKGEVFGLRFRNQDVEKQLFVSELHGFERMLFQMKAAKSKIVFDVPADEIETCYAHSM